MSRESSLPPHFDVIEVNDLHVDCVVGVYPPERDRPQQVTVQLTLELDASPAAASDRLLDTFDYAALCDEASFILTHGRYRLLEAAGGALLAHLLCPPLPAQGRPAIERATVRMTKPHILDGRAIPSVQMTRSATPDGHRVEHKSFGQVQVLHETPRTGLYRLDVVPEANIPWHVHRRMSEAEMILTDSLLCRDAPVGRGHVQRWPLNEPHSYENRSSQTQAILCIDRPPFDPQDEIEFDRAASHRSWP